MHCLCPCVLQVKERCCFSKLEAYRARLEENCHGIPKPAFFTYFPSSLGGIFFNHVSPLRAPKQLTKHSFGPVLSPAPGEELCLTASAKSQIQKVIQGQIPPRCELPSGTPMGN